MITRHIQLLRVLITNSLTNIGLLHVAVAMLSTVGLIAQKYHKNGESKTPFTRYNRLSNRVVQPV